MLELPTLLVYVSYSTVHIDDLIALKESIANYNERENNSFHMEIRYSEKNVRESESLVKFMEEIASARFVVMLFSQAYFQSAYCLFELIMACENQNCEERFFILPINSIVGNHGNKFSELKGFIKQWITEDLNDECLNELKDLCIKQKLNLNDDQIKEKILHIYNEFLNPMLDNLTFDKSCEEIVLEIENNANKSFKTEIDGFNRKIHEKILIELGKIPNLDARWKNFKNHALNEQQIAKILSDHTYYDALFEILKWSEIEYEKQSNDWPDFFRDIQVIAGWIILKSINQDWWINNKLSFTDGVSNKSFLELCLDEDQFSYSEVVVSRGLTIKSAQFKLGESGKLIPQSKENLILEDGTFVLDISKGAVLSMLLTPIYIDLNKAQPDPGDNEEKLLEQIISIGYWKTKIIYYLVRAEYLSKLKEHKLVYKNNKEESILEIFNRELKDKLFFIVIDAKPSENELQIADFSKRPLSLMNNILQVDKKYQKPL